MRTYHDNNNSKLVDPCLKKEDEKLEPENNTWTEILETDPREMDYEECRQDSSEGHHLSDLNITCATEPTGYKCKECGFLCTNKGDIEAHVSTHKKPRELNQCTTCNFKSDEIQSMETHMLIHKDPCEIQECTCGVCKRRHPNKTEKDGECDTSKQKEKPPRKKTTFKCTLCSFETKRMYTLKMHQWSHRDPLERPHQCDVCDYRAKNQSGLKQHKLKHTDRSQLSTFKCTLCSFEGRFKTDLSKHVDRRHNAEAQRFKCFLCPFETKYKYNLENHVLKHRDFSGSRRFMCEVCGFKLKTKAYLQMHQLRHAGPSEIKVFQCGYCPFQAVTRRRLTTHLKKCPERKEGKEIQG